MCILISGQLREFSLAAHSIKKFIDTVATNYNVQVLFNVWNTSYSLFPRGYSSFVCDVTKEHVAQLCMQNRFPMDRVTINITNEQDAQEFKKSLSIDDHDDFAHVAYLNFTSLTCFMELEETLGEKFDVVIKIRPDVMIGDIQPDFSDIHCKVAYLQGIVTGKPLDYGQYGVEMQFHDIYEVYGRTAFAAYGQMRYTLIEDVIPTELFTHTWVLGHLKYYGIETHPVPCRPNYLEIIRPTICFDSKLTKYMQNPSIIPIETLHALNERWNVIINSTALSKQYVQTLKNNGVKCVKRD